MGRNSMTRNPMVRNAIVQKGLIVGLAVALTPFSGCGSDPDTTEATPTPEETISCGEAQTAVDGVCVAALADGWTQIFPGGETICSRGTEYSFYVHPGTVNRLAVGFDGGGACWDTASCSRRTPSFSEEVDESDNPENMTDGLMDLQDSENPFRNWFIVFAPYCTGDVHWGNTVHTYPATDDYPEVTINHKGFVNGSAVLQWVYDHFDGPESIFTTGVSAGSYGSLMHSTYLMEHYPESIVTQLGDSGAGVITQEFLTTGLTNWDAVQNIPDYLTSVTEMPIDQLSLSDVYIGAANYYPDQVFSQFNTAYDWNQEFYYMAMGGSEEDWSALMDINIQEISANAPSFRYYTGWGEQHGILPYPEFYTHMVNGVRVRDWVADLLNDVDVDNVHCTDCMTEETYQAE